MYPKEKMHLLNKLLSDVRDSAVDHSLNEPSLYIKLGVSQTHRKQGSVLIS